jgi:SAM-dependent methyltransferase
MSDAARGARNVPREAAKALLPGSQHYTAYVGPPAEYDAMAATQFRLLTTLGLREHHRLLNSGCGSLRVGRLLIPYLLPGNYHGIEPNSWLIEDAIAREIGHDQIRLKRSVFRANADFSSDGFGVAFDFIVAQSVFSHAGADLVAPALSGFRRNLAPGGGVGDVRRGGALGVSGVCRRRLGLSQRGGIPAGEHCPADPRDGLRGHVIAVVPSAADLVRPGPYGRCVAHLGADGAPVRRRAPRPNACGTYLIGVAVRAGACLRIFTLAGTVALGFDGEDRRDDAPVALGREVASSIRFSQ